MDLNLLSLYDKKAESFGALIAVPNTNAFIRTLTDEINAPSTVERPKEIWAIHPEDFSLIHIGSYDTNSGTVIQLSSGLQTVVNLDVLKQS